MSYYVERILKMESKVTTGPDPKRKQFGLRKIFKFCLVRDARIELATTVWKTVVLPLN